MATALVAYYRVSTDAQGQSGLGLEAQAAAVGHYARAIGAPIIRAYTEVETSTKATAANRPQLRAALAHAQLSKATLVIANLDRLARNVAFLSSLMEGGVDFVACDQPNANRLTLHILVAVAEDEARRISARTKAALAAYKARGGQLGGSRPECRNLTPAARKAGAARAGESARAAADAKYGFLAPRVQQLRGEGLTLEAIAAALNAEGYSTRRGRPWNHVQILRILRRFPERPPIPERSE